MAERRPSTATVPASAASVPAMILSSVDLPAPLRPTIATTSPRAISIETPSSAVKRSGAPPRPIRLSSIRAGDAWISKAFVTPSTRSAQPAAVVAAVDAVADEMVDEMVEDVDACSDGITAPPPSPA